MNKKLFNKLVKSVKEAGKILHQIEREEYSPYVELHVISSGVLRKETFAGKSWHYLVRNGTRGMLAISESKYKKLLKGA